MAINSIFGENKNTSISPFEIIATAKIINNIKFNLNLEDDKNINLILLINKKLKKNFF